ncbi:MAG: glutamate--tRNA ligase family protein, partial [Candidatus Paceibacterota bacterium]
FAPSPTGLFHIGSARTALFNYLFARHNRGRFQIRIEDTDKERSEAKYEKEIFDSLAWLGLEFDNQDKVVRQSERTTIYRGYLEKMIADGTAYISKEAPKEGGRAEVIRFRNPGEKITFNDEIRGEITFDTAELKDFVIAKSLDEPIFHLAVVVDDFEMGVTHVIRGEDHISNTPRQILIQRAIGAPQPIYAHIPLILAPDKSKLSKRKHGESVSLSYFKNAGYLPEAMLNFLALLGWGADATKEIFTKSELIEKFALEKVNKGGAIFNLEKLNWLNKEYLKLEIRKPDFEPTTYLPTEILEGKSPAQIKLIFETIFERIQVWDDIKKMLTSGEINYLKSDPKYDGEKLIWKGSDATRTAQNLEQILGLIRPIDESDFADKDRLRTAVWDYAEKTGRGAVLWPMRFGLTGLDKSPDPFSVAAMIGKTATVRRLEEAVRILSLK